MNHIFKSTLLKSSIALACIASTSAYAQSINKSIDDEIVVTAKGNQTIDNSLFTTHVFTELDIEEAQVEDVPELLDRVAGISVIDNGGRGSNTSVFVRGASSDQTLVLVDGIRVGSSTNGAAALNSYPIEAIERIEVLKGPFAGIYGADAAGGVIQIFTKKGGDNSKSVSTSIGSNGLQEYGASFSAGNGNEGFHISLHHENQSGFSRTDDATQPDRDGFRENVLNFNGKTTFGDDITASLSVLYSDTNVEIDAFGQSESEDENINVVLNVEAQLNDKLVWKNIIGYNENEAIGNEREVLANSLNINEEDLDPTIVDSIFSTERSTFNSELSYTFNSKTNFTTGVDYYDEDISESTTAFFDTQRDNLGYYAQFVSAYNAFNIVTSLRYDDNSDYGTDTNYNIALGYKLNDNIRFSISNGSSFSAPTFNDLFFPALFGFVSNPDLTPEESESYEFNVIGKHNALNWSISLYQTDFDDRITGIFDPNTFLFEVFNVESSRVEGYELNLDTTIFDWNIGLNIDVLSSEIRSANPATDENRLPSLAEETLNLEIGRDFGKFDFTANLKFEHDRFPSGSNSDSRVASYAIYDIRANYQVTDNLVISAKVDNLFDKDFTVNPGFSTTFNTGGRLSQLSVKYKF